MPPPIRAEPLRLPFGSSLLPKLQANTGLRLQELGFALLLLRQRA
jgi:hypothetical protein